MSYRFTASLFLIFCFSVIGIFSLPATASAALAIDGTPTAATTTTTAATLTFTGPNATAPTGVGVGVCVGQGTTPTITGVTYGGVAMTLVKSQVDSAGGTCAIFSIATSSPGAQQIVVTTPSSGNRIGAGAIAVTGGATTTVFSTSVSTTTNAGTVSVTIPSTTDELVMDVAGADNGAGATISPAAGQTQAWNVSVPSGNYVVGGSTKPGAASVTMSWSTSYYTPPFTEIAASFKAAPAASPPTVTTGTSSALTGTTVTLGGNITATGGANANARGIVYGTTSSYTATSSESGSFGTGAYTENVSSLSCATTYHYAAFAMNSNNTAYGTDATFTTADCVPTVTTGSATSIAVASATLGGNITATGGASATVQGVVYGTTAAYTATSSTNGSFSTGAFTQNVTGLTGNTLYHYAAFATNSVGTTYGADQTFTTLVGTSNIVPSVVISRTTGVAPLYVFFDAASTTDIGVTNHPFEDLHYSWNFGDSAAPNWTYGTRAGMSSNVMSGPEVAHVFDPPLGSGTTTYNVTLTVTDGIGTVTNYAVGTITVIDGNSWIGWAGTNTTCVSPAGNWTNCPAGAAHSTNGNINTLVGYLQTPIRYLLHCGETFTDPATGNGIYWYNAGPSMFGNYDCTSSNPNLPVLTLGNSFQFIAPSNWNGYVSLDTGGNCNGCSYASGGSLATTTYYVSMTYVNAAGGESKSANAAPFSVPANNVMTMSGPYPSSEPGISGWNIYIGTSTSTQTKQNATPIAMTSGWTEPATGLITGAALPSLDTIPPTDLRITGINFQQTQGSNGHLVLDNSSNMKNLLIYNNEINGVDGALYVGDVHGDDPRGLAAIGNKITNFDEETVFGWNSDVAFLDNLFTGGAVGAPPSGILNIVRSVGFNHYVLSDNAFVHNTSTSGLGSSLTIRTQNTSSSTDRQAGYGVVADNDLTMDGLSQGISVIPIAPSVLGENEQDVIIELNWIKATTGVDDHIIEVRGCTNCDVRNNIINSTGSNSAWEMVAGTDDNGGTDGQGGTGAAQDINDRWLNNTIYTNDTYNGLLILQANFLGSKDYVVNPILKNNLIYAPHVTGITFVNSGVNTTGLVASYNTCGADSVTNCAGTGFAEDPLFKNAGGGMALTTDFDLSSGSYAIDSGTTVPVYTDFFGTTRPQGAAYDIGAVKYIFNPTLTTGTASSITTSSATLGGDITATGGANSTARGIVYGLTSSYTATSSESGSFGTGAYTESASSLTCATTYHFASYATNSSGTSYGTDSTFTTSACPVSTTSATTSSGGSISIPIINGIAGSSNPLPGVSQTPAPTPIPTTPNVSIAPSFTGNLSLHDTGSQVKLLQEYLNTHGDPIASSGPGSPGNETAYFGISTYAALVKFQTAHGITPSGFFGPLTRAFLRSETVSTTTPATGQTSPPQQTPSAFTRNLSLHDSGPEVKLLQEYLNRNSYAIASSGPGSPGSETTYFGLATYAALVRFQAAHNLPATGFFGPETRGVI